MNDIAKTGQNNGKVIILLVVRFPPSEGTKQGDVVLIQIQCHQYDPVCLAVGVQFLNNRFAL